MDGPATIHDTDRRGRHQNAVGGGLTIFRRRVTRTPAAPGPDRPLRRGGGNVGNGIRGDDHDDGINHEETEVSGGGDDWATRTGLPQRRGETALRRRGCLPHDDTKSD